MAAAVAGLLAVHEADGCEDEGADVPGGGPALLVVVGERGADGDVDVESARGGIEVEFGGCEGVVLVQLQQPEVEAIGVRGFQVVEAEVELEGVLSSNHGVRDRLLFY